MRKIWLLFLLLALLCGAYSVQSESAMLTLDRPQEIIRPGKAVCIAFSVPETCEVTLMLNDAGGNQVSLVVENLTVTAGSNVVWWNGSYNSVFVPAGDYTLTLRALGREVSVPVSVGLVAPYIGNMFTTVDADSRQMTVDFYASVDGLLTVGLWNNNVWSLMSSQQVSAGQNAYVWRYEGASSGVTALTLTLTDMTGYSSNEEHIPIDPAQLGLKDREPENDPVEDVPSTDTPPADDPQDTPPVDMPPENDSPDTPPVDVPPADDPQDTPPVDVPPADDPQDTPPVDVPPENDSPDTPSIDVPPMEDIQDTPSQELPLPELPEGTPPSASEDIPLEVVIEHTEPEEVETVYTPAHGSPYEGQDTSLNYWTLPMDITDEEAVWNMLMQPMTVVQGDSRAQVSLYAEPDENSERVAVVTCSSQGVHVLETLDNGWSLVECYSSSFHDSKVKAWNMLVQGYIKTSKLTTVQPQQTYAIVVDKLTQRLYLFKEGKLYSTLLVSTGLANERQPYNETRSGEFFIISPTGGFWSDNMYCPRALRFNDGDLLHEVPYVSRGSSKIYTATEPYLGQKASHGCIRVQRKKTPEGVNMAWIWDNRKMKTKIVIWEDWQGRQIDIPDDDFVLYYNPNGGEYYHSQETCYSYQNNTKSLTPFTYGQLEDAGFSKLKRCEYCAPVERRAQLEAINAAYAPGGDHDPIMTQAQQKYLNGEYDNN